MVFATRARFNATRLPHITVILIYDTSLDLSCSLDSIEALGMFSAIQSSQCAFTYLPPISSPLVPHDVSVCPTLPFLMTSTFKDERKTQPKSRSNRYATVPPKVEEPERRRQVFLKRVKYASDDKRWQTRSDQVR